MSQLLDLTVVIAGAGAVGVTAALGLARAGARVTLVDPGDPVGNASAVAAGMLAPAFEALEEGGPTRFALLRAARDLWPALADSVGASLHRHGALGLGDPARLDALAAGFEVLGAAFSRIGADETTRRWPWVTAPAGAVWTPEDWRLEPGPMMRALREAAGRAGVVFVGGAVTGFDDGRARLSTGETLPADRLLIATGAATGLAALAPALRCLTPIKGHILTAPDLRLQGPDLRLEGGYVCPGADGAVIGASMETGRSDTAVDAHIVARLAAVGADAVPALTGARTAARTGVRAATPDGLPLVGPTATPDVWLAVGARRNGWLLAPLIAERLVAHLSGEAETPVDRLFAPERLPTSCS